MTTKSAPALGQMRNAGGLSKMWRIVCKTDCKYGHSEKSEGRNSVSHSLFQSDSRYEIWINKTRIGSEQVEHTEGTLGFSLMEAENLARGRLGCLGFRSLYWKMVLLAVSLQHSMSVALPSPPHAETLGPYGHRGFDEMELAR